MRLFTAVTLGPTIETRTVEELGRLRALAPHARWVKVEGVHLTLVFLGEVEEARLPELRAALEPVGPRHGPFVLSVGGGAASAPPRAAR
ncbi:2'-5' RNA ligase family protein, partial [Pyxidicoccus sp. 3LG]